MGFSSSFTGHQSESLYHQNLCSSDRSDCKFIDNYGFWLSGLFYRYFFQDLLLYFYLVPPFVSKIILFGISSAIKHNVSAVCLEPALEAFIFIIQIKQNLGNLLRLRITPGFKYTACCVLVA